MTLKQAPDPKPDPDPETGAGADPGAEPRDQSERPLRDKAPKPRSRNKGKVHKPAGVALKARSKVLERKLAELLSFPAVPAAMAYEHDPLAQMYMVDHFTRSGPRTAALLVEASESNEQLRALLERITAGGSMLAVVVALAAYGGPPLMFAILGMREQAIRITQATTLTPEELTAMMRANADAAQTAAAANNGPAGAEGPAPAPEPDQGQG